MEAALSGVIALLLSLKFADYKSKQADETIQALQAKLELLEEKSGKLDKEMATKLVSTVLPVAKAVNRLNQEVGLS